MARVIAIREVMLKPGVSEQDFERFVAEEFYPVWRQLPPEFQVSVLKGDRGDRVGGYIIVDEFESVETRNRLFPGPGKAMSEEVQRWLETYGEAHRAVVEKWGSYATTTYGVYTDYVEVGR